MAKKKKKSTPNAKATPNDPPPPSLPVIDLLPVQWAKPHALARSSGNNSKTNPKAITIHMAPTDAQRLDLHEQEQVFVCSFMSKKETVSNSTSTATTTSMGNQKNDETGTENSTKYYKYYDIAQAMAVASVHISATAASTPSSKNVQRPYSPRQSPGQRNKPLAPGSIQIASASVLELLDPSSSTMATESNITSPPSKSLPAVATTPVPKTPSTPSSGFSFKSMVASPSSPTKQVTTTPITPNRHKNNDAKINTNPLVVIPLDSRLGLRLQTQCIRPATTLVVRVDATYHAKRQQQYDISNTTSDTPEDDPALEENRHQPEPPLFPMPSASPFFAATKTNGSANKKQNPSYVVPSIVQCLLRAYHDGACVQQGQQLRISYQGQSLDLNIERVSSNNDNDDDNDADRLADELQHTLHLNDDERLPEDQQEVWEAFLKNKSKLGLFEISRETDIQVLQYAEGGGDRANLQTTACSSSTFVPQRVAGMDKVVEEVTSVIRTAFRPELYGGMQPPRGALLHGPSGVGKTALARQVAESLQYNSNSNNAAADGADAATENDGNNTASGCCDVQYVHCVSIAAQTSIVGQAERTLQRYFQPQQLGSKRNRLLILDDVHLICPKRGGPGGSSLTTDQIASTVLSLVEGEQKGNNNNSLKQSNDGRRGGGGGGNLFILAITNSASSLDNALRRPGRLDVEVEVPIPDSAGPRGQILQFHAQKLVKGSKSIQLLDSMNESEWEELGVLAKGFNGADCMLAVKKALQAVVLRRYDNNEGVDSAPLIATKEDFAEAIRTTKPSAIQSVVVEIPKVLWSDIGGMESVKRDLRDAIDQPLANHEMLAGLDIPPPRGVLLYGPPGCSKTLMARALATEGQMNFLAVKGPELLSKWLGESERALASLFRRARMASPSIIFFDEIDAIATKRDMSDSSSSSRLLSQLLTEMDGITSAANNPKQRVVVVAATNRPDLLDGALTRPGRMDRKIYVGVPDSESRRKIFAITLKGRRCSEDIDLATLSADDCTQGFSGAECVAICRDAALLALEESESDSDIIVPSIHMKHLVAAAKATKKQITQEMIDFYLDFGINKI